MIIDAHQHFWKYQPIRDKWIDNSMKILQKDFLPADLLPILKENKVSGTIAVQADQSEEENDFLLQLAQDNPFIKGVVGWIDLRANNVEERLAHYVKFKKFKGVRHILQAETLDFMLQPSFINGISKLEKYNLVYDVLIRKEQLPNTIKLVSQFPKLKFVINHLAKPDIKNQVLEPWKTNIEALKKYKNVYIKVSGLVTEAHLTSQNYSDFKPYLDVVFNSFGVERLLFGSDWPVCKLAKDYADTFSILSKYILSLSNNKKDFVLYKTASKVYNL